MMVSARIATRHVINAFAKDGNPDYVKSIKVRFADFTTLTRSTTLPRPVDDARTVARNWVEPPFDIGRYPSPLAGFRKYSSDGQRLYDEPLLRVAGAAPGSLDHHRDNRRTIA